MYPPPDAAGRTHGRPSMLTKIFGSYILYTRGHANSFSNRCWTVRWRRSRAWTLRFIAADVFPRLSGRHSKGSSLSSSRIVWHRSTSCGSNCKTGGWDRKLAGTRNSILLGLYFRMCSVGIGFDLNVLRALPVARAAPTYCHE